MSYRVTSKLSSVRKQFPWLMVCPGRPGVAPALTGNKNCYSQHERRFNRLFKIMLASSNLAIYFSCHQAYLSVIAVLGRNWVLLANKHRCGRLSKSLRLPSWRRTIPDVVSRVEQIRELMRVRDGLTSIDNLEPEDIALVIHIYYHTVKLNFALRGWERLWLGWCGFYLVYSAFLDNIVPVLLVPYCIGCE